VTADVCEVQGKCVGGFAERKILVLQRERVEMACYYCLRTFVCLFV